MHNIICQNFLRKLIWLLSVHQCQELLLLRLNSVFHNVSIDLVLIKFGPCANIFGAIKIKSEVHRMILRRVNCQVGPWIEIAKKINDDISHLLSRLAMLINYKSIIILMKNVSVIFNDQVCHIDVDFSGCSISDQNFKGLKISFF